MLFWDSPLGESQKNLSLIQFVESHLDICRSFWYPLISAILYTVLSPPIKNLIVAFQNLNFKWGESLNRSILNDGKISLDKYFALKDNYEQRKKNLEALIESQDSVLKRSQELEDEIVKQRTRAEDLLNQLSNKNALIDNLNLLEVISGKWLRRVDGALGKTEEEIEIASNMVYEIKGNSRLQKYSISNFVYRIDYKKIQFCLYNLGDGKLFSFNDLDILPGSMMGTESTSYSRAEIKYVRSAEVLSKT